ncbi:hypothetical protein CBL_02994 [Carabus blaptoides fortunei]
MAGTRKIAHGRESDSDSQSKQNTESEEEGSAVEDHVEYSEHDTDYQQSENSEEDVPSSPTPIHGNYYYGKDKTTKWNKVPPPITKTRKHNIITHLPGCKGPSKNVTTPSESFFLFFDDFVFDLLVENTKKYIVTEVKDNFSQKEMLV